jgi:hypothetical protein
MSVRPVASSGLLATAQPSKDMRLRAVLKAGLETHGYPIKRPRSADEPEAATQPAFYKWLGVEYVPFAIEGEARGNMFVDDLKVPILSIPEFYVIAHAASNGDQYQSIFKSRDREAGVGVDSLIKYVTSSPGWVTDVWVNATPLAPPINIRGEANNVLVAHLYTANLPLPRTPIPSDLKDTFDEKFKRIDSEKQDQYVKMQRFYEEYFVMPRVGEKFVLVELYKNGTFVAVGASKYKVNPDEGLSSEITGVETDPVAAAQKLLDVCPWL